MSAGAPAPVPARLRADARRNVEDIRRAALDVFRVHGLGTALDEVARAAGVSKGTIYHRFGGRQGLIDAVVDELAAARIGEILDEVELIEDPVARLEAYLRRTWLLQFDEPAVNDVLLRSHPGSAQLTTLCERARAFGGRVLAAAQRTGRVREDLTPEDLYQLIWERGVIARACDRQSREDYERRSGYTLRGLRTAPPVAEGAT